MTGVFLALCWILKRHFVARMPGEVTTKSLFLLSCTSEGCVNLSWKQILWKPSRSLEPYGMSLLGIVWKQTCHKWPRWELGEQEPSVCCSLPSYVMMMPFKRQALVEFENVESAKKCVTFAADEPVYIAGQQAFFNYSTSKRITRPGNTDDPSGGNKVLLLSIQNPLYPITVVCFHLLSSFISFFCIFTWVTCMFLNEDDSVLYRCFAIHLKPSEVRVLKCLSCCMLLEYFQMCCHNIKTVIEPLGSDWCMSKEQVIFSSKEGLFYCSPS